MREYNEDYLSAISDTFKTVESAYKENLKFMDSQTSVTPWFLLIGTVITLAYFRGFTTENINLTQKTTVTYSYVLLMIFSIVHRTTIQSLKFHQIKLLTEMRIINYNVPNSQDHLNKHSYFTKL